MKKLLLPLLCCLILSIVALTPRSTAQHTSSEQTTDFQTLPANGFTRSSATVQAFKSLAARAEETGFVRVIVGLRAPFIPEGTLLTEFEAQALDESETVRAQRRTILEAQDVLLARLTAQQYSMEVVNRFEYIPFVAMKVDAATIRHLEESVDVASIEEDALAAPTLAESTLLVGANAAWSSGFTGAGQTVAILDTGVDKFHPFLSGKVVSEACYSTTSASQSISSVCPGGVTSSTASGSAVPPSNISAFNHGTHVAGIAAGRSTNFSGVARDANIIAVQVFSRVDDAAMCGSNPVPCARTYTSDLLKGLERVYALRASYNIAAANMSLGGGRFYSACDAENSSLKAAIDNLRSVNIATAISSGNDGYTDSIGFPHVFRARSVSAQPEMAVWARRRTWSATFPTALRFCTCWLRVNGSILRFPAAVMQTSRHFDGRAPRRRCLGRAQTESPECHVDQVFTALRDTGQPVRDARNGITKPRIRVKAALDALGGNNTCSAVPISVGQTVQGTLATTDCNYQGKYADEYTFNGTAGQQIVVSMSSTAFDTFIYLYGTAGQIIAQDDDGGGGTNSRIPAGSGFFTLPRPASIRSALTRTMPVSPVITR
jgi:subtilisin family serine protease